MGGITIDVEIEEPVQFVTQTVTYRITGTVTPHYPATWDEPEEGGEIELVDVERLDPVTGWAEPWPPSKWTFTPYDFTKIHEELEQEAKFETKARHHRHRYGCYEGNDQD